MTESAPATNRLRRYRSPCLLILPSLSLPPLECCFGTSPIQAEKSRPDRKAFGSATLATRAVASAGPTPGISSSRLLAWLDRCQPLILRSNSRICALSTPPLAAERGETRTLQEQWRRYQPARPGFVCVQSERSYTAQT